MHSDAETMSCKLTITPTDQFNRHMFSLLVRSCKSIRWHVNANTLPKSTSRVQHATRMIAYCVDEA
eukprot:5784468-Amphidinium_carterae.1